MPARKAGRTGDVAAPQLTIQNIIYVQALSFSMAKIRRRDSEEANKTILHLSHRFSESSSVVCLVQRHYHEAIDEGFHCPLLHQYLKGPTGSINTGTITEKVQIYPKY